MWIAAARKIDEDGNLEFKARFEGSPGYAEQAQRDAYDALVIGGMSRLERMERPPAGIERRVDRAVVATRHGLAEPCNGHGSDAGARNRACRRRHPK